MILPSVCFFLSVSFSFSFLFCCFVFSFLFPLAGDPSIGNKN